MSFALNRTQILYVIVKNRGAAVMSWFLITFWFPPKKSKHDCFYATEPLFSSSFLFFHATYCFFLFMKLYSSCFPGVYKYNTSKAYLFKYPLLVIITETLSVSMNIYEYLIFIQADICFTNLHKRQWHEICFLVLNNTVENQ